MPPDSSPHTRSIHDILRQYWGFSAFRPLQEDIIHHILDGKDALALMPTGGGKSLCYQVPALVSGGLCLVISPLIALMKDQVANLRKKGITAFAIFSGMSRREVEQTFRVAADSNCRFLYVSPERLETILFKEYLPSLDIRLVAVDEAHCVSQWGYDFRPPYLRIASIREKLPGVPVLALTASATPAVQQDICEKLSGPAWQGAAPSTASTRPHPHSFTIFRQSFERPNLSYSVFKAEGKINKIIDILRKVPGSSIVYCRSRKRTRDISELLRLQQISAAHYHAGLEPEERNQRQEDWIQNQIRVIVCTNAFGMGIDKPDVRTVIHADVPDCLENYYQEAGRAGRDGKRSYAVLLYDEQDLRELQELASLRFPTTEEVRTVYQAVVNYLQVPDGSGAGQYYDFDLPDFLRKFKLAAHTTLNALKILEQEGWLSFSEQVFLPAQAGFTTGKDHLYTFEKEHPALEPLIKTLLRAYEGIFDQPVAISEKMIAGLLRAEPAQVGQQLALLEQYGLIHYQPQKDMPQLLFLRNRVKTGELTPDKVALQKRKEQFTARVAQMMRYVAEKKECRSRMIAAYFGDEQLPRCGICDNCLHGKASSPGREEFEALRQELIGQLRGGPLPARDLLEKMGGLKKEKAWQLLEWLQAENIIAMDADGKARLL